MIVFFDIGSTLIDGPPFGPARRLSEMLGARPGRGRRTGTHSIPFARDAIRSNSRTPSSIACASITIRRSKPAPRSGTPSSRKPTCCPARAS